MLVLIKNALLGILIQTFINLLLNVHNAKKVIMLTPLDTHVYKEQFKLIIVSRWIHLAKIVLYVRINSI